MRVRAVLVISLLGTALLAGGVVAAANRGNRATASLVALPRAEGDTAEPSPTPTSTPTSPTPTPSYPYALTSPEPPYRVGLPATPDAPRPAGHPLPTGCLSFFHSCAYYGATGADTGGPDWVGCAHTGPDSVRLDWRTGNLTPQPSWTMPTEFVVRAYLMRDRRETTGTMRDPRRLTQARLPVSASSYTFTGLVPGGWYQFAVMELNSSGLSGIACEPVQMPSPAPSPTATRTPAPTATSTMPTPDPAPSATTPTPTATVEP
jgi:hypothetical protein